MEPVADRMTDRRIVQSSPLAYKAFPVRVSSYSWQGKGNLVKVSQEWIDVLRRFDE